MSSVGLSQVNFDVQGLADDDEQQLEEEDKERDRELHELLSKELPEDLLDDDDDDDNYSFSSQGFNNSTHSAEFEGQFFEQGQNPQVTRPADRHDHPSHTLLTRRGEEFIQRSGFPDGSDQPRAESVPQEYNVGPNNLGHADGNHDQGDGIEFHDQAGGYGYHADPHRHDNHRYQGYHGNSLYQPAADGRGQHHTRYADEDGGGDFNDQLNQSAGSSDGNELEPHSRYNPAHGENFSEAYSEHEERSYEMKERDMNDNYTVQYTKNRSAENNAGMVEGSENGFLPPSSELAQLRVLHQARGRKLEELSRELATKEKDYERQIRLLNHHLALMKGERDGMSSSFKHVQELAAQRKNDCDDLERRLQESQMEKEQVIGEKDQTQSELEAAKKTIESLHQQLMELEKSESLSRAREQHENIVMATRKRHEEDVVRLKQKLDEVNNSLLWKNEESKRLHDELMETRKEADRVRLDRAETVNRLTKGLEQSQKQNEELLKSGSTQEISRLQSQLQINQRENESLREHYKTMEGDLVDMKEQLRIHESVSKLGISLKTMSPTGTDAIKRNFDADDWKTPQPPSSSTQDKSSSVVSGLQEQLQHALSTNKTKRDEVEQLRAQLDAVKTDLANHKNEKERMEVLMKQQELKVLEQEKKISDFEELSTHPEGREEHCRAELMKTKSMFEECKFKLEQYEERDNELEELNLRLKSQMSEMIREHDEDKQKSIEQCRQSCLDFHDKAMKATKEQLDSEHEQELSKLRQEIEAIQLELSKAKESYVILSEESRWIEKQAREQCEEDTKRKIEELRVEWDRAKNSELDKLRQTVVTEQERNFLKEKASWQKGEEDVVKRKIQAEIALAKMDWTKEKEKDVTSALISAEKEWVSKYGKSGDWEERMRNAKVEWELAKESEIKEKITQLQKEFDEKLNSARGEWDLAKQADIAREIAQARKDWDEQVEALIAQASVSSVSLAKADWFREQEQLLREAVEKTKNETLATAKEEWVREKKNTDLAAENTLQKEKEKWQVSAAEEQSRALETAEQKWRSEHEDKISDAVKDALITVKESWTKEREAAIKSAVSEALQSAKAAWNESKARELEQALSTARRQWFTKFDILNTTASHAGESSSQETNKTFSYLEAQYSKSLEEFRETELRKVSEENERRKRQALKEQEDKHQAELEAISQSSQADWDKALKELESAYQDKLQTIVNEMEEKWHEKTAVLEEDWNEKYEHERDELAGSYRAKFQKEREELGREMRGKYEKTVEHAQKKLERQFKERLQSAVERAKHDWEQEQEEDRLALEDQHLKKLASEKERVQQELEENNKMKLSELRKEIRQLEEQLVEQKQRYENDLGSRENVAQPNDAKKTINATEKGGKICQFCHSNMLAVPKWVSATDLEQDSNNTSFHELRRQYLATAALLKEDFLRHVEQTRENAAKAIRTEVMKERHATAKRLRKYYLECLKELLENDKEAAVKDEVAMSHAEKMEIMQERLKIPEGRQEVVVSQDSTLTNVTALADSTSGHDRQTNQFLNDSNNCNQENENSSSRAGCTSRNVNKSKVLDAENGKLQKEGLNWNTGDPRYATGTFSRAEDDLGIKSPEPSKRSFATNAPSTSTSFPSSRKERQTRKPGNEASSTSSESLLSLDTDVELHLPSAIQFRQQELPVHLQRIAAPASDFSDNLDRAASRAASHVMTRDMNVTSRDMPRNTPRNTPRDMTRDGRTNGMKHARETNDTQKQQKKPNVSDRTRKLRTKSEPFMGRPTVKFSAPLVSAKPKAEHPSKLTSSSLPKPISDVLPSKPLSPIHRAPPKFSYAMHSRKGNID